LEKNRRRRESLRGEGLKRKLQTTELKENNRKPYDTNNKELQNIFQGRDRFFVEFNA